MPTQVLRVKGKDITIPEGMSFDLAMHALSTAKEQETYGEREIRVQEIIRRYPYEAALALARAATEMYGGMLQFDRPVPGGVIEAKSISIPVSTTQHVLVPWGPFTLPDIEGYLETQTTQHGDSVYLVVSAKIKRKYESKVKALVERARELAEVASIYRGNAISVCFATDEDGIAPPPTFLRISSTLDPIFSRSIQEEIDRSIVVPMREAKRAKAIGLEFKRGALLRGKYGTGKSLTANYIARMSVELGRTFIYVPRPSEYAEALRLAVDYQPAVLFVDDLDRVAQGLRDDDMDELLARIDGVDTKDADIFLIATTNNIDMIHPAFLRPGRTDVIISVDDVDEDTAMRLIRRFGKPVLSAREDLTPLAAQLVGQTPAYIREVVDRAKCELLRTTRDGEKLALTTQLLCKMADVVGYERLGIDASSSETQLKKSRANGHAEYHA